jgi:hypothetical protein
MNSRAVVTAAVLLGLLAGCGGGDDGSADTTKKAAPTPQRTSAPTTESTAAPTKREAPKTRKLTHTQLERAHGSAQALAACLRESGVKVGTDSDLPKSRTMKQGNGVVLRATWNTDDDADIYIGTSSNARRVLKRLSRRAKSYKGRIVVLFDNRRTASQRKTVEGCVKPEAV